MRKKDRKKRQATEREIASLKHYLRKQRENCEELWPQGGDVLDGYYEGVKDTLKSLRVYIPNIFPKR